MNNTKQKVIPLYWLKFIFIVMTIIALFLGNSNFDFNYFFTITFLQIKLCSWIIAFIFVVLIAYALHHIVYSITIKRVENSENNSSVKSLTSSFKGWKDALLFIFSSDYLFARYFKNILYKSFENSCPNRQDPDKQHKYNDEVLCESYACEKHLKKKSRKLFILLSNWSNVIFVCILVIITAFIEQGLNGSTLKEVYFAFLLLHTLSRAIEIVYAFYKDVVLPRMTPELEIKGEERLSNLKRGNRISLAVHSYLEMALLFGVIYYMQPSIINGIQENSLLDYILYSFSVIAFNFSFSNDFTTLGKILHVSQVLIGITLVVLSIANYLGLKDNMSEYEKSDWRNKKYI